jgi:DNA-binding MarR family transcriptional regulator
MNARSHVELIEAVLELGAVAESMIKSVVEPHGLSPQQANLLALLAPDTTPAALKELATRLRCGQSNITLLSAQLEQLDLARRAPDPDDGRVRTLVLTDAGRRVREQVLDAIEERSPFHALSAPERDQLQRLVSRTLSPPGHHRRAVMT